MSEINRYLKKEGAQYIIVREKGSHKDKSLPQIYKNLYIFKSLPYENQQEINKICLLFFDLLPLHVRQDIDIYKLIRSVFGKEQKINTFNHLNFK